MYKLKTFNNYCLAVIQNKILENVIELKWFVFLRLRQEQTGQPEPEDTASEKQEVLTATTIRTQKFSTIWQLFGTNGTCGLDRRAIKKI